MVKSNAKIALETCNITKKYRGTEKYANYKINISVRTGEIFGLLGPNGAGKTTFVRQVCGLLKPDDGSIMLGGKDIVKNPMYAARTVSYLGQIAYTHRALKVIEFLIHTGVYRGVSPKNSALQAKQLLDYFKIIALQDRLLEYLSGGELRLVAFIGALIGLRPIIVLDEPTNDMDPEKRILLWKLMKDLRIKCELSFLLVTHNIHEAQDVVDSVAILQEGNVLQMGRPSEIASKLQLATKVLFALPYNVCLPDSLKGKYNIEILDAENYRFEIDKIDVKMGLQDLMECSAGNEIRNIRILQPSLEDIYINNINAV